MQHNDVSNKSMINLSSIINTGIGKKLQQLMPKHFEIAGSSIVGNINKLDSIN